MSKKLQKLGTLHGYTFYAMDVKDDEFVHFTNQKRAQEILQSGKLLKNPPYKKMGISGVQAVSLVYGEYVDRLIRNHIEKNIKESGPIVCIFFKTNFPPEYGKVEEVTWENDVPLINPKIASYEEGENKLKSTPENVDYKSQILYREEDIKKTKEDIMKHTTKTASIKKYKYINFRPPASVAKEAEKGLEYRKRSGGKGGLSTSQAKKEGVGSGVQRAVNLKNRNTLSPDTVKRMKAFFDRHKKNKKVEAGKEPWEDKGYVAWLIWGGDPGYTWAKKVVKQMETADKRQKLAKNVVTEYYNQQYGSHRYIAKPVFSKEAMDFSDISTLLQPGRTLNNRELARAIRLSISAEHDAVHLYELIADSTTNIFVKKIMQDVANEEKVHVGEFEKLLSSIDVQDVEFMEEGKEEVEDMMTEPEESPVFVQSPQHPALR